MCSVQSYQPTRTLNFIKRNIYRCPPDSKSAFTSLVRPHHEYASGAWDPHTAKNVNSLKMVQPRAARFVKNNYRRTTSASSLIDRLGWSTLSNRRKSLRLCSFYSVTDNAWSSCSTIWFNTCHCWRFLFLDPVQPHRCFQIFIFPQDNFWMECLISMLKTTANCRRFSQWAPFSIVFCHDTPAATGSVPITWTKSNSSNLSKNYSRK